MSAVTPAITTLNSVHWLLGARIMDLNGWQMPVEYPANEGGAIAQHLSVRNAVGIFDVSQMGNILLSGPQALDAHPDRMTVRQPAGLQSG